MSCVLGEQMLLVPDMQEPPQVGLELRRVRYVQTLVQHGRVDVRRLEVAVQVVNEILVIAARVQTVVLVFSARVPYVVLMVTRGQHRTDEAQCKTENLNDVYRAVCISHRSLSHVPPVRSLHGSPWFHSRARVIRF